MTDQLTLTSAADFSAITLDDVRAAAGRINGAVVRTPTLHSLTLSEMVGAEVWLKFENLQFTAAYKERGALNALLLLDDEAKRSEEHTSELVTNAHLVCRLLLERQNNEMVQEPNIL